VHAFEQDLRDVRVLRLLDAEWLNSIEGAPRIEAAISAFRARGGVVETEERNVRSQPGRPESATGRPDSLTAGLFVVACEREIVIRGSDRNNLPSGLNNERPNRIVRRSSGESVRRNIRGHDSARSERLVESAIGVVPCDCEVLACDVYITTGEDLSVRLNRQT
jgi:hypothetical protein